MRCPARVSNALFDASASSPGNRYLHCFQLPVAHGWRAWMLAMFILNPAALAQQAVPEDLKQFTESMLRQAQVEAAENDQVGGKWRGVPRIKGVATISYHSRVDEADRSPSDVRQTDEAVTVRFELIRNDTSGTNNLFWQGREVSLAGGISEQGSYADGYTVSSMSADGQFRGPPPNPDDMTLSLDTGSGRWELSTPAHTQQAYTVTRRSSGQRKENMEWVGFNETETESISSVQSETFEGTIADVPGTTHAILQDEGTIGDWTTRTYQKHARIEFWPDYDDYTLEVRIDDYANWRPLGRIDQPGKSGAQLTARALVVPEGDAAPPLVRAIRFELLDVSHEPGVCMNWPLGASDSDPDLRLAVEGENLGTLSDDDQRLEVTQPPVDELDRPFALARIESYDFGARATLRVTAELLDGRELVGEFVAADGEAAQNLIRLPKMAGPDWIAAAWKQEQGVAELPDSDDNEQVTNQQNDGDGFTLYEEYRGWVVAGKRVEGDPKRKDFFVLNLIGADARKGIELFEKVSELRVHSKLRRSEMSQKTRLMNGNHRDAPQRVEQHGVWVKAFATVKELGVTGAATPLTKSGVSGRPGITVGVGILARDNPESTFNKPHNLPKYFSLLAYDRAIAHELLHSVGVEHHGAGDWELSAQWLSPRNRKNKVGRPYFRELMTDDVLTLLDENGHDLATQYMANDYARQYDLHKTTYKKFFWEQWIAEGAEFIAKRPGYQLELDTPEKYAEDKLENSVGETFYSDITGKLHGEHSGDQDCLMRYYFAQWYPVSGRTDTYYRVTPGTEPFGLKLCRARTGTGINAPSHKPQSRYGDAAEGYGDCFSQITPNDAIPPRKLP